MHFSVEACLATLVDWIVVAFCCYCYYSATTPPLFPAYAWTTRSFWTPGFWESARVALISFCRAGQVVSREPICWCKKYEGFADLKNVPTYVKPSFYASLLHPYLLNCHGSFCNMILLQPWLAELSWIFFCYLDYCHVSTSIWR
jgi:hypothetical protein